MPVATRPDTVLVAGIQRLARSRWDLALGPADVDDHGVGVEKDPSERAIAGQPLDRLGGDRKRKLELGRGAPSSAFKVSSEAVTWRCVRWLPFCGTRPLSRWCQATSTRASAMRRSYVRLSWAPDRRANGSSTVRITAPLSESKTPLRKTAPLSWSVLMRRLRFSTRSASVAV